ncbi:MAG: methyltransferase domain-containing protein [Acidimicrobiales bacterium]
MPAHERERPIGAAQTAPTVDELLEAAYGLDGPQASRELYRTWASTYDSGFIAQSGYRYHEQVAQVFATACRSVLDEDEVVVDIGCGTGLAGQALRVLTGLTVDGFDISPEMLQQAAAKLVGDEPAYRRLIEVDLTQPIDIADASYGGALSVGTFTHGHVGPEALAEVIRILRPGGRAAIGVNAAHFTSSGFRAVLDGLVADGRVAAFELVDVPIYGGELDTSDPDNFAHVVVITVSGGRSTSAP